MVTFLLYLFETGLCLTILFLVYKFFFSKETYFNFNRIYLISIIIGALVIPVIHVSFHVTSNHAFELSVSEIGKVRAFYKELITMSESDFSDSPYLKYQVAEFEGEDYSKLDTKDVSIINDIVLPNSEEVSNERKGWFSIAKIILLVYFSGVAFFLIRLILLTFGLFKIVKFNSTEENSDYKLILVNKEIPPFSFFNYIFVSKEATTLKEFEQILAHEKVHVKERHSVDLYLSHALTVFQWFNPMVWQLQKAIKTTHEYIADSKVVQQGFELFDYQSLLLRQLVSIRSVELVNNFNLLFIKKRIAMMTKDKSGIPAKLKALVIIPIALIIFILFANLTLKSPVFSFTNFGTSKITHFEGVWENTQPGTYGRLISFNENKLSVLEEESGANVVELDISITKDKFVVLNLGKTQGIMKYEFEGERLKIWWNKSDFSIYKKTNFKNSSEAFIPNQFKDLLLPVVNFSKILDQPKYLYNVYIVDDRYYVDNVECKLKTLKNTIQQRVDKFKIIDKPFITTRLYVDRKTEMKAVYDLLQVLRELGLYKVGYAALPTKNHSILHYHATAIPQKLPPTEANGAKMLDKEEVGDRLITISASDNLNKTRMRFETFIKGNPDYIALFQWDNKTPYESYLAVIDMTYSVVYKLRDIYSLEKYNMKYNDLPGNLQIEIRKEYPLRITQANLDEDFN